MKKGRVKRPVVVIQILNLSSCIKLSIDRLSLVKITYEIVIIVLNFGVSDVVNVDVSHVNGNARGD